MTKVLVIVDMQNDFTTGVLGNAECAATIDKIAKYIDQNAEEFDKIILTRDTHQSNYLSTQEGTKLPVVHCIENTDGWQIVDEVMTAVKNSEIPYEIIDKITFGSINLIDIVRNYPKDTEYTFVGVCTGICVISNVILTKTANPEAPVKVIADLCACVTPDTHKTALNAMRTCQVMVIE